MRFKAGPRRWGKKSVAAWVEDQHHLSDKGETYFASVQFCFTGVKLR